MMKKTILTKRTFFRDCMPYSVDVVDHEKYVVVYNRSYEIIYKGELREHVDVKELFEMVSYDGQADVSKGNCCLYNDDTNPMSAPGSIGYKPKLMKEYLKRLDNLFRLIGNKETKIRQPYNGNDLTIENAWKIISTMSKSLETEDRIIADLMAMIDEKKEYKKEVEEGATAEE